MALNGFLSPTASIFDPYFLCSNTSMDYYYTSYAHRLQPNRHFVMQWFTSISVSSLDDKDTSLKVSIVTLRRRTRSPTVKVTFSIWEFQNITQIGWSLHNNLASLRRQVSVLDTAENCRHCNAQQSTYFYNNIRLILSVMYCNQKV